MVTDEGSHNEQKQKTDTKIAVKNLPKVKETGNKAKESKGIQRNDNIIVPHCNNSSKRKWVLLLSLTTVFIAVKKVKISSSSK